MPTELLVFRGALKARKPSGNGAILDLVSVLVNDDIGHSLEGDLAHVNKFNSRVSSRGYGIVDGTGAIGYLDPMDTPIPVIEQLVILAGGYRQLAEKLGFSRPYVYRIVKRKKRPSFAFLAQVRLKFGIILDPNDWR